MGYCTIEEVRSYGAFDNTLEQWFPDAVDLDAEIQSVIDHWAGYIDGYLTEYTLPIPTTWPFFGTLKTWNVELVICALRKKSSAVDLGANDSCESITRQLVKILSGELPIAPPTSEEGKGGLQVHQSGLGKFPEGIR